MNVTAALCAAAATEMRRHVDRIALEEGFGGDPIDPMIEALAGAASRIFGLDSESAYHLAYAALAEALLPGPDGDD